MTSLQRVAVALLTVIVVFSVLAVLVPPPGRDGDSKLIWAILAALAAGAIVMVSL